MKRLTCPEDKGMCQHTAFGFRLQRLLFPGSPASWPALHTSFGLNNLYKIVSQWLKTSLYLHTHTHIHSISFVSLENPNTKSYFHLVSG